jgi:hypothetical protein
MLFSRKWMKLEIIMLSKVTRCRKTSIASLLSHLESKKEKKRQDGTIWK